MKRNRKTESGPEKRVRAELHGRGHRFRKNLAIRADGRLVRPDIVFTRARLAVFVDGCFWHCCPEHGTQPESNTGYWGPKLARNVERDREVNDALVQAGWTVLRGWEHESAASLAERIEEALEASS
jgi:DNA mismatch endonuclease (patch repair protein)